MPKRRLPQHQRNEIEDELRDLMLGYRTTNDVVLRAKIRAKVVKTMGLFDVQPLGHRGLPYWMRE